MRALDLVTAFYERVWNASDSDVAAQILAPTLSFRGSLGTGSTDLAGFGEYLRGVHASLADYRCEIVEAVEEGERCFARVRFTGRHVAPLLEVPATGRTVSWEGAALFHCSQGRIERIWVLGDVDRLREQLQ